MKTIGLDLSINSTGICVCEDGKPIEYIIVTCSDKKSKKALSLMEATNKSTDHLSFYIYKKSEVASDTYSEKETAKTNNLIIVGDYINQIVKRCKPDHAFIEGISYGSVGSAALADLSGLNFVVRWVLSKNNIPFTIVSPNENKKNACGNGAANKDEMVYAWFNCDNQLEHLADKFKFDDIADAYFLANTPIEK